MSNINDLTDAMIISLDEKFPGLTAYDEKIKQGFEEPCFFIKILTSGQDKELNNRYKKRVLYDIHYFSDKEDINTDCNDVADKLYCILENINVNGRWYRASKMTHEIIDDVLHFNLQFDYHVVKSSQGPSKMNKLKVGVKVNGG